MKYLPLITLTLSAISCGDIKEYPNHVGNLSEDLSLDDKTFNPCAKGQLHQYYNFGENIQYKGEKRAIINTFKEQYNNLDVEVNGYITIRFIVNCMGEAGRFRVKTLDKDYKPLKMNPKTVDQILEITKNLDGWQAAQEDGKLFDYYQYLTFKLTNGEIKSILP